MDSLTLVLIDTFFNLFFLIILLMVYKVIYIVLSDKDSITHFLSKGNCVPKPLFLTQGLLSSQLKVSSNCFLNVSGAISIFFRASKAFFFHPSELKSKNH